MRVIRKPGQPLNSAAKGKRTGFADLLRRLCGSGTAVVEWSFGWLLRNRRLSNDYERKAQSSETFVEVAMIRLMLKRLARGA
jgi:Transposase DDE domain